MLAFVPTILPMKSKRKWSGGCPAFCGGIPLGALLGLWLASGLAPDHAGPHTERLRSMLGSRALHASATAAAPQPPPPSPDELRGVEKSVRAAFERVRRATVAIRSSNRRETQFGSGVIVDREGLIITAGHVLGEPGRRVSVTLSDGRKVVGRSLGISLYSDAGLVRLQEKDDYPFVDVAAPDQSPSIGDWCFALGHPGGPEKERGVVLRIGRVLETDPFTLRTSCQILGGDSGGPLFNLHGVLIGAHSRISEEIDENFHVSASAFRRRWASLLAGRSLGDPRGWLGLMLGEPPYGELRVKGIVADSGAAVAGLRAGDLVTHVDGESILSADELEAMVGEHRPGEVVRLGLIRDRESMQIEVTLTKDPSP